MAPAATEDAYALPFNSATNYNSLIGNNLQTTSNNNLQVLTIDKDGYVEKCGDDIPGFYIPN